MGETRRKDAAKKAEVVNDLSRGVNDEGYGDDQSKGRNIQLNERHSGSIDIPISTSPTNMRN